MIELYVAAAALLGVWPHAIDAYYQHEMRTEVRVGVRAPWVTLELHAGGAWWGRPDAKIPSSFLNLEATRTLERFYGASLRIGPPVAGAGVIVYRRGVDELDRVRAWGLREIRDDYAYSIGYYDGLRAQLWVGPVTLASPWLVRWNAGTLPSHAWLLTVDLDRIRGNVRIGGERPGAVADVRIRQPLTQALALGLLVGWPEPPGWTRAAFRVGAAAEVWVP